jgi:WD40 repeat protein
MKPRVLRIVFAVLLLAVVGTWAKAARDEPAPQLTEKVVLKPEGGARKGLPDSWRRVDRLAFSPDGKILAFTEGYSGTVHLWDVANSKEAAVFESILLGLVFSPDGKTLATCGDRKIMLWDVASRKNTATLEGDDAFDNVAFSPDGKTLAAVGKTRNAVFPKKWLTLWDVEKKKELKRRQIASQRDDVVLYSLVKRPLIGFRQRGETPLLMSYVLIDAFWTSPRMVSAQKRV